MTLDPALVAGLLALGAGAGFLAGLLGVGGGMVMVPFLTFVLAQRGYAEAHLLHAAIATSLATICFTSLSSVRGHHARGAVRWDIVRRLGPAIVAGSLAGAQFAKRLDARYLGVVFALFVALSATQMLLDLKPRAVRPLPGTGGMLATGAAIGGASAVVGAGGAFLSVPFMVWCNVRIHEAVGTSAALGFPIAAGGTLGYIVAGWSLRDMPPGSLGFIDVPALLAIAVASVACAPLGVRVAHRLGVAPLRRAFAALLYALAGYMAYRSLGG